MQQLIATDGDLARHRTALEQLTAQNIEATARVDALKKEHAVLGEAREELRSAQTEMKDVTNEVSALKAKREKLGIVTTRLQQEHDRVTESLRNTGENANQTAQTVNEVEEKLKSFTRLNELSKTTDERLSRLNALAEHVMNKVKALKNQERTVEHAIVESKRVSEMVWDMDVQIGKLNEASKQMDQLDVTVNRIETVSKEINGQLDQAQKTKKSYATSLADMEKRRREIVGFIKQYTERLTIERTSFDVFDQRVKTLGTTVDGLQHEFDDLSEKATALATIRQQSDDLGKQLSEIGGRVNELDAFRSTLDDLEKRGIRSAPTVPPWKSFSSGWTSSASRVRISMPS